MAPAVDVSQRLDAILNDQASPIIDLTKLLEQTTLESAIPKNFKVQLVELLLEWQKETTKQIVDDTLYQILAYVDRKETAVRFQAKSDSEIASDSQLSGSESLGCEEDDAAAFQASFNASEPADESSLATNEADSSASGEQAQTFAEPSDQVDSKPKIFSTAPKRVALSPQLASGRAGMISFRQLTRFLKQQGYRQRSGGNNELVYVRVDETGEHKVSVPNSPGKDIKKGTLSKILKRVGQQLNGTVDVLFGNLVLTRVDA